MNILNQITNKYKKHIVVHMQITKVFNLTFLLKNKEPTYTYTQCNLPTRNLLNL